MNILSALLALTFLASVFTQAVKFHHSTVCRQKIWQNRLVSITGALLDEGSQTERSWVLGCGAASRKTILELSLRGKL